MAKLVDALALGASGVTHGGSSPLLGTQNKTIQVTWLGLFYFDQVSVTSTLVCEAWAGIEPAYKGFAVPCLTT